jgi:succinyl-CoA synthetase alpha subunit
MNFTANKVLIQGITESLGSIYAPLMQAYSGQILAGISPGHGGQELEGIPIFDLVEQALLSVGTVDTSVVFVPPYQVLDAALEAIAAGIRQIIIITEGVPPMDMTRLCRVAEATETLVVGPNCPGIIVPGQVLLGTHPAEFYTPGSVGLVSRCGTLTYEVAKELSQAGFGQSIALGIGSDHVIGSTFQQWLQILDEDEQTEVIVLVGKIGSDSEEAAAQYIMEAIDKPVVAYIAGCTLPQNQKIGHAGAVISSQIAGLGDEIGTAKSKIAALKQAKVAIAESPSQLPDLLKRVLKSNNKSAVKKG